MIFTGFSDREPTNGDVALTGVFMFKQSKFKAKLSNVTAGKQINEEYNAEIPLDTA